MNPILKCVMLRAGLGLWGVTLAAGLVAMAIWDGRPGIEVHAPTSWPFESTIGRVTDVPTLVFFAHPHCPCTRASLRELEQLVQMAQGKVAAHVLLCVPEGAAPDWEVTDVRKQAAEIPGVCVHVDVRGAEARRFGASTSGEVMIFNPYGQRCFRGGITQSRGHEGDNSGLQAAADALRGGLTSEEGSPTFGCPLFNAGSNEGPPCKDPSP